MGYVISKTGFGDLPRSAIQIDPSGFDLTDANIVSGNYSVKLGSEIGSADDYLNYRFVVYNGTVTPGTTVNFDPLVLFFNSKAKDSSGKRYDVRITYTTTMVIPADYAAPYTMFTRCTPIGILQITSMRGLYPPHSHDIEGASVHVTVDILDNGTPIHETTMFACLDIDMPDTYNVYYGDGQRYGVDGQYVLPYQEQVRPVGQILSPVYMDPNTLIITNAEKTAFGGSRESDAPTAPVEAAIAYQVETPFQVIFALSQGAMILFTRSSAFEKFNIVSSAGTGGNISPNGSHEYNYNTTGIYNISPDYGYEIEDVKVDGVSVGPVSSYTFSNIKADHTIHVDFVNVIPPCRRPIGDMNICGESKLYIPEDCEDETS